MNGSRVTHVIALEAWGGAESNLLAIAGKQLSAGYDVSLVLIIPPGRERFAEPFANADLPVVILPLRRDFLPGHPFVKAELVWRLTKYLRTRARGIVHLHLCMAAQVGRVAAGLAGCPNIMETVHCEQPCYSSFRWQKILLPLMKSGTAQYITVSEALRRFFRDAAGADSVVIPNGCSMSGAVWSRDEARKRLRLPAKNALVGFVGRLSHEKNLQVLIKAMQLLKPESAALVVLGDGKMSGQWRRMALDADVRACFTGAVEDAWRYFPAFNVLCLPSSHEAQGLVLVEAMLQRIPVIGSDAAGIVETLCHGRVGWIHGQHDYKTLAGQITYVLSGNADVQAKIESAYVWARDEYSLDKQFCRLDETYRAIVKKGFQATGAACGRKS